MKGLANHNNIATVTYSTEELKTSYFPFINVLVLIFLTDRAINVLAHHMNFVLVLHSEAKGL